MTDTSKLIAEATAISSGSPKIRLYAIDNATATVSLDKRLTDLEAKVAALTPVPVPPPAGAWKFGRGAWALGGTFPADTSQLDMVIAANWQNAKLAAVPPPCLGLVYTSLLDCPSQTDGRFYGMSYLDAKAGGFLLHDTAGNELQNDGYPGNYLANFGNPDYVTKWTANVLDELRTNKLDGVQIDDVVAQKNGYTSATVQGYATAQAWEDGMTAGVNQAAAALKAAGFYVVLNAYKSGDGPTFARYALRLTGAQGIMLEDAFNESWNGTDAVQLILAGGKDAICLVTTPTTTNLAAFNSVNTGRGVYMTHA